MILIAGTTADADRPDYLAILSGALITRRASSSFTAVMSSP
jgi:hypothetical protein